MSIAHFIAHQISRNDEAPATVSLREHELPINDNVNRLIDELKSTFISRANKHYGQFNNDAESTVLHVLINDLLDEKIDFLTFTQKATALLVDQLNKTSLPLSGHILFCEEKTTNMRWLHLFHLQHQPGLSINQDLEVIETEYADISRVGFAGRINLSNLTEPQPNNYLTFSINRQDKIQNQIFTDFLGFIDTLNTSEDTLAFLNMVDAYSQNMPEESAQEYKDKIVEYCIDQDKQGEAVVFESLSQYVDEEQPEDFEQFIKSHQNDTKSEFIPDKKSLKRFINYSGRHKGLSISFSSKMLGDNVRYDEVNETLTLNQIPKGLLSQLKNKK